MKLVSKKFIAFILSLLSMTGILITALLRQEFTVAMSMFMSCGIISLAALCIGYVISQSALDKFISGFPIRREHE